MGVLSGNPKEQPMHYGEVFGVWSYLTAAKGMIAGYQTFINHAGDADLKKFLEDQVQEAKRESEEIESLLKVNGVGLPPAPLKDRSPIWKAFPQVPNSMTRKLPLLWAGIFPQG